MFLCGIYQLGNSCTYSLPCFLLHDKHPSNSHVASWRFGGGQCAHRSEHFCCKLSYTARSYRIHTGWRIKSHFLGQLYPFCDRYLFHWNFLSRLPNVNFLLMLVWFLFCCSSCYSGHIRVPRLYIEQPARQPQCCI